MVAHAPRAVVLWKNVRTMASNHLVAARKEVRRQTKKLTNKAGRLAFYLSGRAHYVQTGWK